MRLVLAVLFFALLMSVRAQLVSPVARAGVAATAFGVLSAALVFSRRVRR